MSADRPFIPEFGPNGSVLNAPHISPERRAEILKESRLFPPPVETVKVIAQIAAIYGFLVVALNNTEQFEELLTGSSWWSGFIFGAMFSASAVMAFLSARKSFRRWEVLGPTRKARRLVLPGWARWTVAIGDALIGFLWFCMPIVLLLTATGSVAPVSSESAIVAGAVAVSLGVSGVVIGGVLRTLASARGWTWRDVT